MELPEILDPKTPLNKAYRKQKISRAAIELFKTNLKALLSELDEEESEEHVKNDVIRFLDNTWYKDEYAVNTKGRTDLVIHNEKSTKSSAGVLVEVKRPGNKSHMVTKANLNTMAMQELLLYYLRERVEGENKDIKHLIVTNVYEWFIFDAAEFYTHFYKNAALVKGFKAWSAGLKDSSTTQLFYKEIAAPVLASVQEKLTFTYFDFRDYKKFLTRKEDSNKLISLYKLLSPVHLLKQPFANDSNSLNRQFYNELLHIIGLEEVKQKGKKVIQRKNKDQRDESSLLENAIAIMDERDRLRGLEKPSLYGRDHKEQLYTIGLELCITWINRILFLKLLESQLVAYHNEDRHYNFLNTGKVPDYDALEGLFFGVLARKPHDRAERYKDKYANVPYLNSSLFEPTDLENVMAISMLNHSIELNVFSQTVLKDAKGKRYKGKKDALTYLFEFLDAYDFSSEGKEKIQEESKSLINASVLGLIFEKINGYKDGSFYTPGFITMYMCRETIRKAVVQKFNEARGWELTAFDQLYDRIDDKKEANEIINSLKVCDPAVGSGHFLVSALNEIIAIKSELKILQDREGKTLRDYHIEIENDELVITDDNRELFEYTIGSREKQRMQETLFNEKQAIIENCLFGVDINPNSVKICRLRLWIELLKSAYYKQSSQTKSSSPVCYADSDEVRPEYKNAGEELETLPNIDINIKCGNSLVSRFALDSDISAALKKSKWDIGTYRTAVDNYKNATKKEEKREFEQLIDSIKGDFETEVQKTDKRYIRANKLSGELFNLTNAPKLFEQTKAEKKKWKTDVEKKTKALKKVETELEDIKNSKIYENAFEWRFEFPEVLDDAGNFIGFDVVIGNPPYAVVERKRNTTLEPYANILEYSNLSDRYNDVIGGKLNLYRLFIKLAYELTSDNSEFGFIIPLTLIGDNNLRGTREFILKNFWCSIIHCFPQKDIPSKRVFEDAKQSTVILLSTFKKLLEGDQMINLFCYPRNSFDDEHKHFKTTKSELIEFDPAQFRMPLADQLEWNVLKKLHKNPSIGDIESIKVRRGEINQTIYRNYISSNKMHSNLVKGVEVGQYQIRKKLSQGIKEYFDETLYKSDGNENQLLLHERIAMQRITGVDERLRLVATIVGKENYFADSTNSIHLENAGFAIEYLLGLINCKLYQWRFKKTSSNNNVGNSEVEALPFKYNQKVEDHVCSIVNQILALKKENPEADTSELEQEIDQLVYKLYNLTEEEIAIVEGSS